MSVNREYFKIDPQIQWNISMVVVAQLVRAPDCGSGGRGFETHQPPNWMLCPKWGLSFSKADNTFLLISILRWDTYLIILSLLILLKEWCKWKIQIFLTKENPGTNIHRSKNQMKKRIQFIKDINIIDSDKKIYPDSKFYYFYFVTFTHVNSSKFVLPH